MHSLSAQCVVGRILNVHYYYYPLCFALVFPSLFIYSLTPFKVCAGEGNE